MTRRRADGLIILSLGSVIFLLFGWLLAGNTTKSMNDFKAPYYGAKCLLQKCDPYDSTNLKRIYHAEEGERQTDSDIYRTIATTNVYFPPTLVLMLPFALLHYGPAHLIWMALISVSFIAASVVMWDASSS